jgi:ABC-type transport system involved in multi-copper enzyme maturation permease subunit
LIDLDEDRQVFAAVFQYFYLRLAIFFGCLGIFMNLFRGEMLDETLHFWFLVPSKRETLLVGKYLAGLIATVAIFTAGAAISFLLMLWPQETAELAAFWPDPGLSHLFWYCASAALACVGYGSVFLAAGLLLRNPIIPAVVILGWEGINNFLPPMLQKLSVLHYVQALAPVPAPTDDGAPLLIQLLMAPAEPPSATGAILGLLAVTALVLWAAGRAVRRLEINYSTD